MVIKSQHVLCMSGVSLALICLFVHIFYSLNLEVKEDKTAIYGNMFMKDSGKPELFLFLMYIVMFDICHSKKSAQLFTLT